ncbi:stalk domain-containing protein [Paenibacillus sp. FSL L8-0340]|uniref:stalk domain-containing protein n=1 Tax=Paenibacillus sp. FSL L8-0340 TaxID=2954685 RepID=UPI00315904E5
MKKWTMTLCLLLSLTASMASIHASAAGTAGTAETTATTAAATVQATAGIKSYGPEYLIKNDGSLWIWGDTKSVPTLLPGLKDVQAAYGFGLQAGGLAVTKDNAVWRWQTNPKTLAVEVTPVQELTSLTELSTLWNRYIAIDGNGAVFSSPRVSDEDKSPRFTAVPGIDNVAAVNGYSEWDGNKSLERINFLKKDGTVWTSRDGLSTFEPIQNLTDILQLTQQYALKKDGTLWTWPIQSYDSPNSGKPFPSVLSASRMTGLTDIRSIHGNSRTMLAIDGQSRLWFWGSTVTGWSDGTNYHEQKVPVCFTGIKNVTGAYFMERSIVALTSDGNAYSASLEGDSMPAAAKFTLLASDITSIQEGERHLILQKKDGSLFGWGVNKDGQLGYGEYEFSYKIPVPVQKPIAVSLNGERVALTNGVITRGGENFIPLRSLFDKMGANVSYKEDTKSVPSGKAGGTTTTVDKKVTITRAAGDKPAISITINSVTGVTTVNNKTVTLANPPFVVYGTIYLPLRFISEQLGATVNWMPQEEEIAITYK